MNDIAKPGRHQLPAGPGRPPGARNRFSGQFLVRTARPRLCGVCCARRPGAPFRLLIPAVRTWQAMPAPKRIKVIALTTLLVGVALILATLLF